MITFALDLNILLGHENRAVYFRALFFFLFFWKKSEYFEQGFFLFIIFYSLSDRIIKYCFLVCFLSFNPSIQDIRFLHVYLNRQEDDSYCITLKLTICVEVYTVCQHNMKLLTLASLVFSYVKKIEFVARIRMPS